MSNNKTKTPESPIALTSVAAGINEIQQSKTIINSPDKKNHKKINIEYWDKYLYLFSNTSVVNIYFIIAFISCLLAMFGVFNMVKIGQSQTYIFIPFTIIGLYILGARAITYLISSFYPKFYLDAHIKTIDKFWKNAEQNPDLTPVVDVLIPTCGEDVELIRLTLEHVKHVKYPAGKLNVTVLDDVANAKLVDLVESYGYNYLSRPNRGEHKKAGNLQYGYDRTDGVYALVLDADFCPHKDFLLETIPYLEENKQIGILQTPQYFQTTQEISNRSWVEYGAGVNTEDFYRFIQPTRDVLGGAICVGTSAIYRRQAIVDGGGCPIEKGSDDVMQGLAVHSQGYIVKYLPIILSRGICPDTLESFFKQHERWCGGTIDANKSNLAKIANLPVGSKLCYFLNFYYYTSEAMTSILSLNIFFTLAFAYDQIRLEYIYVFIPLLMFTIYNNLIMKVTKYHPSVILTTMANTYTYLYTVVNLIFGRTLVWVATNAKKDKISPAFKTTVTIATCMTLCYIILLAISIYLHPNIFSNDNTFPILVSGIFIIFSNLLYLYNAYSEIINFKKNRQ